MATIRWQRVAVCFSSLHHGIFRLSSRPLSTDHHNTADEHEEPSADQEPPPSSAQEQQHGEDEEALKLRILNTAIEHHVREHGWTRRSLQEAGSSLGMSSAVHGMFPNGGFDLVDHFYKSCNRRLGAELRDEPRRPTADFVRRALQTRLHMVTPHVDTWPQAMALQALPQHALTSWGNLCALADEVWFLAGDRSTDMAWYSKRAEAALVYKSSELFLLQDRSPGFADTWAFLDRRLQDVQSSGRIAASILGTAGAFPELARSLAMIARNVTRLR